MNNITIITEFGVIDKDIYDTFDSNLKKEFDKELKAAEIFFQDEIRLESDKLIPELNQQLMEKVAEYYFEYPERALTLYNFIQPEFTDINFANIEENIDFYNKYISVSYILSNSEYLVLTRDEAEKLTRERLFQTIADLGLFGLFNKDEALDILKSSDAFNEEYFEQMQREQYASYIEDIESEEINDEPLSSDEYLNRLHNELVENGIMEEPEYPDIEEEPENYEKYIEELQDEIENNKENYIDQLIGGYDSPIDWYLENFGDIDSLNKILKQNKSLDMNELLNMDKLIDYLIDSYDLIPTELAVYDGTENVETATYKNKNYEFYIYRTE